MCTLLNIMDTLRNISNIMGTHHNMRHIYMAPNKCVMLYRVGATCCACMWAVPFRPADGCIREAVQLSGVLVQVFLLARGGVCLGWAEC